MFNKILIANRGEIACRIIKTARRLGVQTVAVFSEADRNALHVLDADEAVCIGPAPSVESYLRADKILNACRATGAEAVHPGYGFLSERASFAESLAAAGLTFIGPPPEAIASMGDKITSKRIAAQAGVNTIPWCDEVIRDADHAVAVARQLGYPVMLKATAGGGGKGMRTAYNDDDCRGGFARASGEARSSFGDDRVFIEKFIQEPRHIEVQVLADAHGAIIHLGERECSLQRRHQKVMEEAPSAFIDDATRNAMGAQAVALARAVGYQSAGTVEFVVDQNRNFYFLEMNTRLQVEHPVTECVTGLDLVEQMIRIAAGERLPLTQQQVQRRGWSIEARVYAEDPTRNFLPSVGRLVRFMPPAESRQVRVDTGVYEGGEVSVHYDPMVAKLITHGDTREAAAAAMRAALNRFYIRGIAHNLSFLGALVNSPHFAECRLSTDLIERLYPDGFQPNDVVHADPDLLIAVAACVHRRYMDRAAAITGQTEGYERQVGEDWVVLLNGQQHPVAVRPLEEGVYQVVSGQRRCRLATRWQFGQPLFFASINDADLCVQVERRNMHYRLSHWGAEFDLMVLTTRAAELFAKMPVKPPPDESKNLLSPMPGLLTKLMVAPGDPVKSGQDLAVIEAMKMENLLRAEHDAIVSDVYVEVGDSLATDQPILGFE